MGTGITVEAARAGVASMTGRGRKVCGWRDGWRNGRVFFFFFFLVAFALAFSRGVRPSAGAARASRDFHSPDWCFDGRDVHLLARQVF